MDSSKKPSYDLAKKVLPSVLFNCIEEIFNQTISGCGLVGGTALSGFYAGHRRSDDIDLFTKDSDSLKGAVLAVKHLKEKIDQYEEMFQSNQYYKSLCSHEGHSFTIDVVLDTNLFKVGQFVKVNHIFVADLNTILKTKAATLVSRCSEKDLYDLLWLLENIEGLTLRQLIKMGSEIDSGVNGEAILTVLLGTKINEDACDFSLISDISKKEIAEKIINFKEELIRNLVHFLKNEPTPSLGKWVKKISKYLNK